MKEKLSDQRLTYLLSGYPFRNIHVPGTRNASFVFLGIAGGAPPSSLDVDVKLYNMKNRIKKVANKEKGLKWLLNGTLSFDRALYTCFMLY